ncbi:MAG: His/Gly/Thr/Pro-type tRNA ligase C-terminal domain-containing protein, partial [Candidatus Omnitrophica bacterium]|nr:His/Gly/Thr/Pro-type tRNA ligase C-terminal domain-containing protein [Candidatus Omnitrophota bacterium]
PKTIEDTTGAPVGFSGPVGLKNVRIVADHSVKDMVNFITGANKKDAHLVNVNFERDCETKEFGDFRMITKDDPCPACGKAALEMKQAIEVGHTFKLGTKYSDVLSAKFLDKDGKENTAIMGCYGIGVNRIMATAIEISNDKDGIIWPLSIAPYQIIILALNIENKKVKELADEAYKKLSKHGYDVLYDDRNESAGVKFKDADLIGIPVKVIIGEKNAKKDMVEVKDRKTGKVEQVPSKDLESYLKAIIN